MTHYVYYAYEPVKEGPRLWRWKLEVLNKPQTDLIARYTGITYTRRGAVKACAKQKRYDHMRRLPGEISTLQRRAAGEVRDAWGDPVPPPE